ncbi:hypothetical protein ABT095_29040 [Kitasatospora sp. NPDC002227]|uniref:hypothetical protein n=1 Tax=Kitasatospora sp. NPDC002227 TaxID=3154773 RepID=UPI00331E7CD1
MTSQGERDPRPADGSATAATTPVHRVRRSKRRVLIGCGLAVLATGAGWIVTRPHPGDWIPGLGPASSHPAKPAAAAPAPAPAFTPEPFTAARYFPADRAVDLEAFKGHRTVGAEGATCAETLGDRAHDVLTATGCQGYLKLGFVRSDQQLLASVTVLRYADAAAAAKARQGLDPAVFAFTSDPAGPAPGSHSATGTRIEAVGPYVTVTVLRFTDQRATDPELDAATRAVSYTAGAPFGWM